MKTLYLIPDPIRVIPDPIRVFFILLLLSTLPLTLFSAASNNPTVSISPVTTTVSESVGSIDVTVSLSERPNKQQIQIRVETLDGTAFAGTDYTYTLSDLSFSTGASSLSQTVTIPIINNVTVEGNRSFSVTIADHGTNSSQHFTISNDTTVVTITDDDGGTQPPPGDETIPTDDPQMQELCGVFEDGLQTTNPGSSIDMSGGGGSESYLYNNPDNNLNTYTVTSKQTEWWPSASYDDSCQDIGGSGNDETCIETGVPAPKLNDVTMLYPTSFSLTRPVTTASNNITYNPTQPPLLLSDYNQVDSNWNAGSTTHFDFDITNRLYVKFLNASGAESSNITFNSSTSNPYSIAINTLTLARTTVSSSSESKNIAIGTIATSDAHNTLSLSATQTIKIESFNTNHTSSYTLSAPYININTISDVSGSSQENTITLIADYIDIGSFTVGDATTLNIQPFTPGKNVVVKMNTFDTGSNNTINFSKGTYYIKTLNTNGSGSGYHWNVSNRVNLILEDDWNTDSAIAINADTIGGNNLCDDSHNALDLFIYSHGSIIVPDNTRLVATIYTKGDMTLSSASYVKGAITSGDEILLNNDSAVCFDQNIIGSGYDACNDNDDNYQNSFTCGLYPSVLTSYQYIGAMKNDIINTCFISTPVFEQLHASPEQNLTCTNNGQLCNGDGTCTVIPEPKNRYEYTVLTSNNNDNNISSSDITLTDANQGNWTFNNGIKVIFDPTETYTNNTTKLMKFGDVTHNGNGSDITFKAGDYHFQSWNLNDNNINIHTEGAVRIFIEDDFIYPGNNISFFRAAGSTVFIYVRGDMIMNGTGGGSNGLKAFFYTEGSVTINNNSNNAEIFGGITAEGALTINGNNINFIYDEDGADNLGLGECKLCYDENFVHTNGIFGMCMPFMFTCQLDMPIRNIDDSVLDNVIVTETYKSSMSMSFPMGSTYATLDKDGNSVGNGGSANSSTDYSMYMIDISLDTKSNSYDFGDGFPSYLPGENYYRAYKQITMSMNFDFTSWRDTVVYLGDYTDSEGRDYHVQLEACNTGGSTPYITGPFDAWDTFRDNGGPPTLPPTDRNISTKIVNQPFYMTLASLNKGNNNYETKYGAGSSVAVGVYSNIMSSPSLISNTITFDANVTSYVASAATLTPAQLPFTVSQAEQVAAIGFKLCASFDYNSTVDENIYYLYPDASCSGASTVECNATNPNPVWRICPAGDAFAVRPAAFDVNISTNQKFLSQQPYSLDFRALDNLDSPSNDYNETENSTFYVDLNISDPSKNCVNTSADISPDINFSDGNYTTTFTFDSVGNYDLNISEYNTCSSKFASVDCDDSNITGFWTQENNLSITPFNTTLEITPHHFSVTYTLNDASGGNGFTYLSSDPENMGAELNITIIAEDEGNATTLNYSNECYAKDGNITISYSGIPDELNITSYFDVNTSSLYSKNKHDIPNDLNLTIDKSRFVTGDANGTSIVSIKINLDRNITTPVNPFVFTLDDVNYSDDYVAIPTIYPAVAAPDNNITYVYGRLHTPRYRINGRDGNITHYYEVYCSTCNPSSYNFGGTIGMGSVDSVNWYRNRDHNSSTLGTLRTVSTPRRSNYVTSTASTIFREAINYSGVDFPHKAIMDVNASPWLINNRFDSTVNVNSFDVEFNQKGAVDGNGPNSTNDAAEVNSNRRIMW